MSDSSDDELIETTQAGQHLCGFGPAAVRKHIRVGTRLPDGRVLRLKALRIVGTWRTSRTWVKEYLSALAYFHTITGPAPPAPTESADRQTERLHRERAQLTERVGRIGRVADTPPPAPPPAPKQPDPSNPAGPFMGPIT